MSDDKSKAETQPTFTDHQGAPIVYFDGVLRWGAIGGVAQIELGANVLVAVAGSQSTRADKVVVARLRCTPKAAADLRASLDRILLALTPPDTKAH